jgi:hypothetical protein
MAQTQDAMSFRDVKIEISTNGSVWDDASGFANMISISGGDRLTAETFTADGEYPIVTTSKRSSMDVTMRCVYTEGGSDPYETLRQAYENGTDLYIRWSPKGGASGDFQYTTPAGIVMSPMYPTGDAGAPDAIVIEVTIKISAVTKSVVA